MTRLEVTSAIELEAEVQTFVRDGYVVLRNVVPPADVLAWRDVRERLFDEHRWMYGADAPSPPVLMTVLEREPQAALATIAHPRILGLAEAPMGPIVQLDSAVLCSASSRPPSERGAVVAWHRDRYGHLPNGAYLAPAAIVCFAYLQPMTKDYGPLRVVPGSHVEPLTVEDRQAARADEVLVHTAVGDVVLIHHMVLHSGTACTAGDPRSFFGWIYSRSAFRQQDSFDGPVCAALRRAAEARRDRRMLRLLGADPLVFPRQNSGFVRRPEVDWTEWLREDEEFARADI